ncbi:MAG: hypothetical protein QG567_393 [Campylobacterota bacterium]|nr:hypothetical protein [Campylobacterota bacterium]
MAQILLLVEAVGILKDLEESFDFDIVDEFLSHFEIMCLSLEPAIGSLEDESKKNQAIEELFRVAHNLKSASGYLNLVHLNKFAAFIEDILDNLRNKDIKLSARTIDWFYGVSDQLNDWYQDLATDKEEFRKINIEIFNVPQEIEKK